jgi:hypothetical protein
LQIRPFESFEDQPECRLNFRIGVQTPNAVFPVDQSDSRPHLELATPSFIEHPASHPGFESRYFPTHHQAGFSERHLTHQLLKPIPARRL